MSTPHCAIIICLLAFLGCGSTNEGTLFKVNAALTDTTCGSGAVNAKDNWDFQVRLKKDDTSLTWYDVETGATTQGSINDGAFSVSDSNIYEVTVASAVSTGCSVRRHDNYSGDVTFDTEDDIAKLEGDIAFKYSQATGYTCDSLIGATDGFDDLPCEVDYTFVATPE